MIHVTDDTPITVPLSPSLIRALVREMADTWQGDDVLQALGQAIRYGATDDRTEELADEINDFVSDRTDAREEREEQHAIDTGDWTENQRAFIEEARAKGLHVRLYSGRGMMGAKCPAAVGLLCADDFQAGVYEDAMGMDRVVYARG